MNHLRPYQIEAADCVSAAFRRGAKRVAVVMPTGTGKTHVAAEMSRRASARARTLFLAHREELIEQAAGTMIDPFRLSTSVEMADRRGDLRDQVVVASVPSLQGARLARWPRDHFGLIIVDEAHHAPARSYLNILEHFSSAWVVGITATFARGDGVDLAEVFPETAYRMEIKDAIDGGWLVPVRANRIPINGLDLSQVKTSGGKWGDFQDDDLAEKLLAEGPLQAMAAPIVEQAGTRPTLVFCANVKHSHGMAAMINRHGVGLAVALDGSMPAESRRDIISRFRAGRIRFLCSCALLLEGFDAPVASCVAMARMTRSVVLYTQALGRGTRLLGRSYAESVAAGKSDLLVLDLVGVTDDGTLICPADVLEGRPLSQDERKVYAKASLEEPGALVDDLLGQVDSTMQQIEATVAVDYDVIARDPFRALGLRRPREADGAPRLTEKQKETRTLQTMGVDLNRLTQREGSALIGEAIRRRELGLCSLAQVRTLAKHGIDGRLVTFLEAGRVLSAIASNGWRANKQIRDSVKRVEEPGRAPARMAV